LRSVWARGEIGCGSRREATHPAVVVYCCKFDLAIESLSVKEAQRFLSTLAEARLFTVRQHKRVYRFFLIIKTNS